MRATILDRYGKTPARLAEIALPQPGPRDLLIKVKAAGLNPVDFKFQQGQLRIIYSPPFPFVMGNELAGEVIGVGAAVRHFTIGDRIFARVEKERGGAFAEQVCIDESVAARMPAGMDFATAAAVPLAGLTALQALRDEVGLKPGHHVLISGGAGGVGTFAIQIAKWLGAHVTTTASPRGRDLVLALGADAVIDYTAQKIIDTGRVFDAGFDLIGGATLSEMFEVMRPGAKIVSVAALPEPRTAIKDLGNRRFLAALFWFVSAGLRSRAKRNGVDYRFLFMHPSGHELGELAALIETGQIKVTVDATFAFADIAAAMAYLKGGRAKGKIVVTMD